MRRSTQTSRGPETRAESESESLKLRLGLDRTGRLRKGWHSLRPLGQRPRGCPLRLNRNNIGCPFADIVADIGRKMGAEVAPDDSGTASDLHFVQ